MAIVRWTPLRELEEVFDSMFDRSLTSLLPAAERHGVQLVPAMDVVAHGDDLEISLEVPGIDPEKDLDVSVENNILYISGERRSSNEERNESFYVQEMVSGTFLRSFPLPEGVEEKDIKAEYTNGVLRITVPKGAAEAKDRKHIQVSVAEKGRIGQEDHEGQQQGYVGKAEEAEAQGSSSQGDLGFANEPAGDLAADRDIAEYGPDDISFDGTGTGTDSEVHFADRSDTQQREG